MADIVNSNEANEEVVEEIVAPVSDEVVEEREDTAKDNAEGSDVTSDDAEPVVEWNDEAEYERYVALKNARIEADKNKPFDPEALLEVRHLRKAFPLKKTIIDQVFSRY